VNLWPHRALLGMEVYLGSGELWHLYFVKITLAFLAPHSQGQIQVLGQQSQVLHRRTDVSIAEDHDDADMPHIMPAKST
jgi:hypothetical protein